MGLLLDSRLSIKVSGGSADKLIYSGVVLTNSENNQGMLKDL